MNAKIPNGTGFNQFKFKVFYAQQSTQNKQVDMTASAIRSAVLPSSTTLTSTGLVEMQEPP
jgi:hypothetical protein